MVDVIVVGAGSSGAVIAARVSEDPNRTVLLLEAGPDYPDLASTPLDLADGANNSYRDHDWGFDHQPTNGRKSLAFPRGKVTGGSSAVNTAIALRGVPEDYDAWARLGNTAWSWESVLPAFKRLERDLDYGRSDYHGDAGPITIRRHPTAELTPVQRAFVETARAVGYPACPDANAPWDWGVGPHPMNKLGRLRISSAVGYLAPARIRPNLTIRPQTFVRRVIIEGGHCTGVEVESSDRRIERVSAKLVVLSAGAVMTPAILMRSGIGPRAQLEAHGIDVVGHVPGVGENLSDHPALSVICIAKNPALIDSSGALLQSVLRFTADGSEHRNDMQIQPISFAMPKNGQPTFMIATVLEHQHGRGQLRLRAADPRVPPLVEQRFCEDSRDVSRLVSSFRRTLELARTKPLSDLIEAFVFPDLSRRLEDVDIANLCRRYAGSGFHVCGTAKMGPAGDPDAVVDQHGRCRTVDQLVIADASIMPAVPRANTNLTCMMIGERVGEWLRTEPAMYGLD